MSTSESTKPSAESSDGVAANVALAPDELATGLTGAGSQSTDLSTNMPALLLGILKTLRPQQWFKNVFVLAPLFFSKAFLIPSKLGLGLLAAFLFCLVAGTVYLINDIFDVAKDRQHPIKWRRPIASGVLPVPAAHLAAWVLGAGSIGVAFYIDVYFGAAALFYLLMNLAYSSALKHFAFVDVSIIATGFVLRVLAGAFAIDVYISEWLLVCTFCLALFLGLGKRQHELKLFLGGEVTKTRKVLERYKADHLDFAVLFVAGMTIAVYTIYTLTAALPDQPLRSQHTPFASPWMPITIPFAVFGITRFYQLINMDSLHSPTDLLLKDWPFIVNLALWGLAMLLLSLMTL